jgi:hypothetical protein
MKMRVLYLSEMTGVMAVAEMGCTVTSELDIHHGHNRTASHSGTPI